ncbi:DUF3017 domain-containing protein [Streptomyces sp. NPDC047821]|uniref:DUF3017 domain-containing protein n=1 Tax=Streptomyces sp. NPDC047821 TaxID=3365488 RepID=UPI0037166BCC
MGVRANDDSATPAGPAAAGSPTGVPPAGEAAGGPSGAPTPGSAPGAGRTAPGARPAAPADGADGTPGDGPTAAAPDEAPSTDAAPAAAPDEAPRPVRASRRPPTVTRDTARPEGGGRAAPGDAPAPARQWPLLTVLGLAALGLLVVGFDPFPQAPRIGAMLIGVALLTGAAMRRALPSVGMLAVRSRFTDMAAYGVLGASIVLLALMTQPDPWLEIPFLEDAVRFAVR